MLVTRYPTQGTFNSTLVVYADLIFVIPGGDVNNPGDRLANFASSVGDPNGLLIDGSGKWQHAHKGVDRGQSFYITIIIDRCLFDPDKCHIPFVTLIENSFTATASNGAVTIAWETASEIDNAGFFIWRGQIKADKTECSLNGEDYTEVKKISPFILAQGSGAYYSYDDSQVASGNTCCYVLQDIDLMDKSTYHLDDITSATVQ